MAETYMWASDADLGVRVLFSPRPDGSLQVTLRGAEHQEAVLISQEGAAGLRAWMDQVRVGEPLTPVKPALGPAALREWLKDGGETADAGTVHLCPNCHGETQYQAFSGGREWFCPNCGADGTYPGGRAPGRAGLLTTVEGRTALREQMRAEIAARQQEGALDAEHVRE